MGRKPKTKEDTGLEKVRESTSSTLFDKTLNLINEEYGNRVLEKLTEVKNRGIVGLSSGSIGLDWCIFPEAGGMELGKVIELYGAYSSGKTTISLGFCANATANKQQVIFLDAERTLQSDLVTNAGIDDKYFHVLTHIDGRVSANIAEKLLKTGEVGVFVIDSLPAWRPLVDVKKGEDDSDFTKPKMAFQSSFLSNALPHLVQIAADHNAIIILLNQIRNNLGSYAGGVKPFGGHAVDHTVSVRLRLTGKAKNTNDKILDSEGKLIGQYTTILAEKNKIAIPLKEIKLPLFLGKGINPYMELTLLAVQTGLVTGTAGRFNWVDSGESIAHGANNFAQKLFDDETLYMDLRNKVIEKLGIKYNNNIKVVNAFHDFSGKKRLNVF